MRDVLKAIHDYPDESLYLGIFILWIFWIALDIVKSIIKSKK